MVTNWLVRQIFPAKNGKNNLFIFYCPMERLILTFIVHNTRKKIFFIASAKALQVNA